MGVNKAIILGRLGKDPELRYTPSGQAVTKFTVATSERYTGKDGQRQERTEWHNIVAWGKTAELANQYLNKGSSVFIEGRITSRSWDDKDGNKRYCTEIVATSLEFLSGKDGGNGGGNKRSSDRKANETGDPQNVPIDDDLPF